MTAFVLTVLAVLAAIAWYARRAERIQTRYRAGQADIDRDLLRQAEEEVRDLGVHHHPDEGFEGDDWGPGAPR